MRRALAGAMAVGVAVLAVSALLYANASGTTWLAGRTSQLGDLDLVLTDAEVGQQRINQALLLAVDLEAGLTTTEVHADVIDHARRTLGAMTTRAEATSDPTVVELAATYAEGGFRLLDALAAGERTAAESIALGEVSLAQPALVEALAERRQTILAEVEHARSSAGITATGMGFVLALLLPVAMFAVYRALARRQVRQAERAARLASERELSRTKDEFIANVSHELRTPLTGIYGFAQVLEEGSLLDPETSYELVNLIIGQAAELSRMVDDLLTAARADADALSFEMQRVDLGAELVDVIPAFERFAGPIAVEGVLPMVLADPIRLRQVLRNLLANARNHGGPKLRIVTSVSGSRLECAVVDDGEGVPPELEERMFDRFVHAGDEPLRMGSVGLGLFVARLLVEGMGGELRYERAGGSSRFVVVLDLADPTGSQPVGLTVAKADG